MAVDTPSVAELCARANAAIATSRRLKEEIAALLDAAHAYAAMACARLDRPLHGRAESIAQSPGSASAQQVPL